MSTPRLPPEKIYNNIYRFKLEVVQLYIRQLTICKNYIVLIHICIYQYTPYPVIVS